jgi:hypothetical protein
MIKKNLEMSLDKVEEPWYIPLHNLSKWMGVITIKWTNNDKGLKDYNPFCGHFHFLIKRTFGMKSFAICY